MQGDDRPTRTIPIELLLLCADPLTGRFRFPSGLHRAFAGGILGELLLAGAITVDDRRLLGIQPLLPTDPVLAGVLSRLGGIKKLPTKLEYAVRLATTSDLHAFRCHLLAQELMRKETHRALGFLPYLKFFATDLGIAPEIATRVRSSLAAASTAPDHSRPPELERDCQLAALMATISLDSRHFPGPEGRPARTTARKLATTQPIAQAVRRVITSDKNAD
ncbi:GOLPH3/VPS74 family protein [Streptomyces sp. YGL11-2]|uniref:GOLPH3/VPS74 family protein n=1 Tax=Streptomyces sp. YGL11-2 TaxID=3414028 RepID=UPI003CEC5FAC